MKKYEDLIDELENAGFDEIVYDKVFDMLIIDTTFYDEEDEEIEFILKDIAWMFNVEHDTKNLWTIGE